MKLLLKLAVAALVGNALWHVGSAYVAHIQFRDAVRQAALGGELTDAQLRGRVMELAAEYTVPMAEDGFTIRRVDRRTAVEGSYVRTIDILPGYGYPWRFSWAVDGFVVTPPNLK